MGVMDWMDGDEGEDSDTVATDGLGFDEDFDDLDGEMDDLDGGGMGGLDDEMDDFGDDMGGFDDGDDLGGPDIDADTIAEMEDRISELENEVSSVSSSMNTVREENKQIGETVDELDDTIRKLLDIYEMVTRGINPFVDDAQAMGGLDAEGAFGLFDSPQEEEEGDLDSSVADADAEEFFDDDFGELDGSGEQEAEMAAEDELIENQREGPGEEELDEDDGGAVEAGGEEFDEDGGAGASFDDLKSEYEEEGGWEEEDATTEEPAAEEPAPDTEDPAGAEEIGDATEDEDDDLAAEIAQLEEPPEDETGAATAEDGADAAAGSKDGADATVESEDGTDATVEVEDAGSTADEGSGEVDATDAAAPTVDTGDAETVETDATMFNEGGDADSVYLASMPASYVAEFLALEWVEYLVDVGGVVGARRALRRYEDLGWISEPVRSDLTDYLDGVSADADAFGSAGRLDVDQHTTSLTYISRLAGDVTWSHDESAVKGGNLDGIRR